MFSFNTHNPESLRKQQDEHIKNMLHKLNISDIAYQKLYLYCVGITVAEIAALVHREESSIENVIKTMMVKLDARDRHELIIEAYRLGLIPTAKAA